MINLLVNLNNYQKKLIVLLIDIILCFLSFNVAIFIRTEKIPIYELNQLYALLISFLFIPIFYFLGLYNFIFRYLSKLKTDLTLPDP